MKQTPASILLVFAVLYPGTARGAVRETDPQKNQAPTNKKAVRGSSLTGCIDQQEGNYVLLDNRSRSPIADLVADGFPTEGFAKHVGHKVTVRGTSSPGGSRPVVKVRSIETVSETCTPQQEGKV